MKLGDFAAPTYATGRSRRPRPGLRDRAGGRRGDTTARRRVLDVPGPTSITRRATTSAGLLSLAFAPDYASSGRFYVYLTGAAGDRGDPGRASTGARATADVADPAARRLLLAIPHTDATNHNGGQLQFGPDGQARGSGPATAAAVEQPVRALAGPGVAARQADPARRRRRRGRRWSRSACATRGASRSIARTARS